MVYCLRPGLMPWDGHLGRTTSGLAAGMVLVDWLAVVDVPRELSLVFLGFFGATLLLDRLAPTTSDLMRCLITAGPTSTLDAVRRLTNFSSGRLGSELAAFLSARGHAVSLLIGQQATWRGERHAGHIETFTTTANLRERLQALAAQPAPVDAVFHAAAVSDFAFGQIWRRFPQEGTRRSLPGRSPPATAPCWRSWCPRPRSCPNCAVGFPTPNWQVGNTKWTRAHAEALILARRQIEECRTDACVLNGPAYGPGFGLVLPDTQCRHLADPPALFEALESHMAGNSRA